MACGRVLDASHHSVPNDGAVWFAVQKGAVTQVLAVGTLSSMARLLMASVSGCEQLAPAECRCAMQTEQACKCTMHRGQKAGLQ